MNFHPGAPNSHIPAINPFEFLVLADNESAKHAYCESHTVSAENSLCLLVSNTCLVTDNNSVEI